MATQEQPAAAVELVVILLGDWRPLQDRVTLVCQGQAVIQRCRADRLSLRNTLQRLHPSWLLLGEGVEDAGLARLLPLAQRVAPQARIVVLGPADDVERCERWLRHGAAVYLASTASPDRVVAALVASTALHVTMLDDCFQQLGRLRQARFLSEMSEPGGGLSRREIEIVHLVQHGSRNATIASQLRISENTVEYHLRNILRKLGVTNHTEAAERATALGL